MITGVRQAYIIMGVESILISILADKLGIGWLSILATALGIYWSINAYIAGKILDRNRVVAVDLMNDELPEGMPTDLKNAINSFKDSVKSIKREKCNDPHCENCHPLTANASKEHEE